MLGRVSDTLICFPDSVTSVSVSGIHGSEFGFSPDSPPWNGCFTRVSFSDEIDAFESSLSKVFLESLVDEPASADKEIVPSFRSGFLTRL